MSQLIFSEEWMIEARLAKKTSLSERQTRSYRLNLGIEGVHFKHLIALGETDNSRGLLWYDYPKINQLVQEAG